MSDPQPSIDYYSSTGSTGQFASRVSKATFNIKRPPPRRLDLFDVFNRFPDHSDYYDSDDEIEMAMEEHEMYCDCGNFFDHDDDFF